MMSQATKHEISVENTTWGWKAVCSCGKYTIGFYTSADKAKRAMLNSSHPEDRNKETK